MLERKQDTLTYLDYSRAAAEPGAPLLLMLHGYGSNEKDLLGLAPVLDSRFRILSLQAPMAMGEEMYAWFPLEFTETGITVDREAAIRTGKLLQQFIRDRIEQLRPAGDRVFLMGFSQGSVMSYLTAFCAPEILHGVVAMSGQLPDAEPESGLPEHLEQLPFLVVHGIYDDVLAVERGREASGWLKHHVTDLTYREYPMGHEISDDSLDFTAAWLKGRLDLLLQD